MNYFGYRQLQPADPELDDDAAVAAFDVILRAPGMTLIVIDRAGQLIATAYLNVIPNLTRSASPYAVIESVVVDEPFRGTGIGKQIMTATLKTAWAAGCCKAMLLTGSRQASTHAFYRACGFAGERKDGVRRAPRILRSRSCSGYRKAQRAWRVTGANLPRRNQR